MTRPRPLWKRPFVWVGVYLLLLGGSHFVRWLVPRSPRLASAEAQVQVAAANARGPVEGTVRIVYRDLRPEGVVPVVLLLHGSPGSKDDLGRIANVLAERYRAVLPDLPGFGRSTRSLPDYSLRSHAGYMLELLDRLGIERVHLVGFSMGGGVALELYDLAPERVQSVTLLSSIGVQEGELLGEYHLNHLIHGLQLAGLWLLYEGVPHMGLLDGSYLDVAYARNFFDSDQRPLRSILSRCASPVLLLHGESDFLVDPAVARESHRLVPQSELQVLRGSHFLPFTRPRETAERIRAFLERVESSRAPTRSSAEPIRLAAAAAPFDRSLLRVEGFALVVVLLLIVAATLVSEDLTCIGVGFMVAHGRIGFLPGVAACFAGIFVGDLLLFLAGRTLGRHALRRVPLRWLLHETEIETSSRWLSRRGPAVIVATRFVPGSRLPTYFAAGMLRTSFWSFSAYFGAAALVWTPLLVALAWVFGGQVLGWLGVFRRWGLLAGAVAALVLWAILEWIVPLLTFRGRRRLVGRWNRLRHWEFWPPWMVYPPVVAYIAGLAWKHGGLTVFTAANPVMPAGGFIAESKSLILEGLSASREFVARTRLLPAGDDAREELALRALHEEGLEFPVVLKPDVGQRGSGVAVIRNERELRDYLRQSSLDVLLQEYVPGIEFGLFYRRHPDAESGGIFSVTEKRMPFVTGDGARTLERLVLEDDRAVSLAHVYFARQRERLAQVPEAGERVQLVELGTHCLGAVFLDGGRILTAALQQTVDRISKAYPGFFFGRYDVRAPSVEDLRQGRNFKIIELNGVTSEATHIYDPRNGILEAWRVLRAQWRTAFEIGARNRDLGARPTPLLELLRLTLEYRRLAREHPGA